MINILILLAVTFWGLSFIGTKIALDYLTPVEIISIRLLLGLPVLYLALKIKKIKLSVKRYDCLLLLITSLILGFHIVIQAVGLIYTSATNTAWLIATIPAFIAVMSYIFLKEKLTKLKILGILVATFGVLLLVSRGDFTKLDWLKSIGDWIILSSCITWSVYTIITRNITRRCHPLLLSFALLFIPTVGLIVYTLLVTPISKFSSLPVDIVLILLFLGILCSGLAHWFWMEGLSKKGAINLGVFLYFEPIVTTVAAIPILGEKLTAFIVIGAILIISGVYLVEKQP